MQIPTYLLVLLAILSLFPVFGVAVWLFLRQEAMRGDIATAVHKVDLMVKDYNAILAESVALNSKVADVSAQLHAADIRAISFTETITALSNKINSREREIRKREKQEEEGKEVKEEVPEVDLNQLGLPLFDNRQPAAPSQPPKRRFGQTVI